MPRGQGDWIRRSHGDKRNPPGSLWRAMVDDLVQDLRFGVRGLTRNPGFTIASAITLAFRYGGRDFGADITVEGRAERVRLLPVNGDYFDVLGADMILGRPFSRDDEQRGAAPVVVISERLWRRAMQADPGAVGRTLRLDDVSHRVSGVVSSDLVDPLKGSIDVWVPQHYNAQPWEWDGNNYLTVLGRLSPGVSLARARAEVARRNEVQMQLPERYEEPRRGVLVPLHGDLVGSAEPMLMVLMGAVAVLLLITCANVTALVLARGVARGPELSIRAALGSGRGRLVRQLVIESLVLASIGAGAGAGLVTGAFVQRALVAVAPAALPQAWSWPRCRLPSCCWSEPGCC